MPKINQLGKSSFDLEWILKKSNLVIDPNDVAEIASKSKIIELADSESGQMSDVFRIQLPKLPRRNDQFDMIVKIPSLFRCRNLIPGDASVPDEYLSLIHNSECTFYENFNQSSVNSGVVPLAECFLAQKFDENQNLDGIIAVKDLSSSAGFVNLWDGLTLGQCLAVAETWAKFHAHCLKMEFWINKFHDRSAADLALTQKFFEMAQNVLATVFPDVFTAEEISKASCSPEEIARLLHAFEDEKIPPILAHGDPWANNLMFGRTVEGEGCLNDSLVAIIDWQECHPGALTEDIARMLVTSVTAEFRRKNAQAILQHYSNQLRAHLGPNIHPEITFQVIKRLYDKQMVYSVGIYSIELCLLLKSEEFQGHQERVAEMVGRLKSAIQDVYG